MTDFSAERRIALVTGISGQDGSYLAELLLEKGYTVHGLSRRLNAHTLRLLTDLAGGEQRLFFHPCDVIDYKSVYKLIRNIKPQEIYNLAAQSHVGLSFTQPELTAATSGMDSSPTALCAFPKAMRSARTAHHPSVFPIKHRVHSGALQGVINIMEAILDAGLGESVRFFEASSCEIFGRSQGRPCNEKSAMHPQTPYGKAKLLAYIAVKHYRRSHQLYACSGILFNHESPRRGEDFVTRKITKAVANIKLGNQEVLCLGNLDASKDWGHARDYVGCMWLMLQQQKPADIVVGTGINTTVREFVELAFERVGMPVRWQGPKGVKETGVVAGGSQAGKIVVTVSPQLFRPVEGSMTGDPSKSRLELGWQQRTTVSLLVNEMVDADLDAAVAADMMRLRGSESQ